MIALVSVMGKASRSRRRKWANKVKRMVAERAEIIPGLTCRDAPPTSDDRGEVSESAADDYARVHLAVRLPRPDMTHDDEWRVRQERGRAWREF